ncbi:winged helix-turn-helix domain-containing protein [Saxibacter everestensis]|uniref:Winged helix-turn-helix domain-containing protein n=1 Tax=Saxibacter everestensis TaxID=2909229 RepID=A0ABY8QZG5_9MICO|nr:winged helix-turn-helix domain-containing protein [Brevibacteriaceae bacterium ZFBP1038]
MTYEGEAARDATAEEAKALAHPVRIRILQVLRGESKTNKEIAEVLGTTPGATLHHINLLADQGFIETQGVRAGRRGAREVPYSATGKTTILSFQENTPASMNVRSAILQSAVDSYTAASETDRFGEASITLHLTPERLAELRRKLQDLVTEYKDDPTTQATNKYGFFGAAYRHKTL